MKKIFCLISISVLFASCASTWFNKNKNADKNKEEGTEENIPVSSIEIPQAPEEIEEPLVRDLETSSQTNNKVQDKSSPEKNTQKTSDIKSSNVKADNTKTNEVKTADNKTEKTVTDTKKTQASPSSANNTKASNQTSNSNSKTTNQTAASSSKTTNQTAANNNKSNNPPNYANLNNKQNQSAKNESTQKTPDVSNTKTDAASQPEKQNTSSSSKDTVNNRTNDSYTKMTGKDSGTTKGNAEYPGFVKDDIEPPKEEMNYTQIYESNDSAVPSRSVTLKRGELLQVIYPGSGWIYLGSLSEYNNLESRGRKVGDTQTIYTLYAKDKGTQLHHFYKTDNLTGNYIDDYLEVIVLDIKGSITTSVKAPDYTGFVPKQPDRPALASTKIITDENQPKKDEIEVINANQNEIPDISQIIDEKPQEESILEQSVQINTEELSASELLKLTKEYISNKDYINANKTVNLFLTKATDRTDEGLYLKGQILEANSSLKDIKSAIETYENLVHNYPSSALWEDANKRIKYLKRFYIDIY
ncbi:MAG: outer membrane protein assembly factor BamD [Treponema sp.]|nr:outer membrane protein assembly factor BamD [Treponema sp.]